MNKKAKTTSADEENLIKLLSVKPDTLAREQFLALKEYAATRLREIAQLIEDGNFKEVVAFNLENSSAGDGYGEDNQYISFYISKDKEPCDIGVVIETLELLKKQGGLSNG